MKPPRNRILFYIWGALSACWLVVAAYILHLDETWVKIAPLYSSVPIVSVSVQTEIKGEPYESRFFGKITPYERIQLPTYPIEPSTPGFQSLRKYFPSWASKPDKEFAEFISSTVQGEVAQAHLNQEETARSRALEAGRILFAPPLTILLCGLLMGWIIRWINRHYPPRDYSPYTKKVIAAAIIWMLASGSWATIEESGDLYFFFEIDYYSLLIFLPPVVIVISAMLWAWANRMPEGERE